MKYFFIYLGLVLLFVNCKNEKKAIAKDDFELTIDFKYAYEDTLKLYYTNEKDKQIDGSLMMILPIHPRDDFQKQTFVFPKNQVPYLVRLDLGTNPKADKMEIKEILLNSEDKIIDKSDIVTTNNWSLNEFIEFQKPNIFVFKTINGKKSPVLMSNQNIINKLKSEN